MKRRADDIEVDDRGDEAWDELRRCTGDAAGEAREVPRFSFRPPHWTGDRSPFAPWETLYVSYFSGLSL